MATPASRIQPVHEVPAFRSTGLMADLPASDAMRRAIRRGVESMLFECSYLVSGELTNVAAHGGGLDRNASIAEWLLTQTAIMCRIYEALCPEEDAEIVREE